MKQYLAIIMILASLCAAGQKKDYRWKYMSASDRLDLLKTNVQRTGTVKKVYSETDGDLHVWIQTGDSTWLAEIICYKATGKCAGYTNTIQRPKVGQHIRILGDLVWDGKHHWNEIHPVKKITTL
jgi:hypothetical protein